MRDKLLKALRDVAQQGSDALSAACVAKAAGVDEATVLQFLGPAENYQALLSYQQVMIAATPADTRERILQSAARVFACKGLQRATLDEVASDAGMTKGAIYWHFKSKNDLFFALLDHRFQECTSPLEGDIEATIVLAQSGKAREALGQMFKAGLRRCTDDTDWPRLYFECVAQTRDPEVRGRFASFYARGCALSAEVTRALQARGLAQCDVDPEVAAVFWGALFDGLVLAHLVNPGMDMDGIADKIFSMLWRGIAPESAGVSGEK